MLMGKQVILAVFVVPVAFGAEPEFQIRPVPLCPAADSAFVPGNIFCLPHLLPVDLFSMHFFWRHPLIIPCTEKENQEIQQGSKNSRPACRIG